MKSGKEATAGGLFSMLSGGSSTVDAASSRVITSMDGSIQSRLHAMPCQRYVDNQKRFKENCVGSQSQMDAAQL